MEAAALAEPVSVCLEALSQASLELGNRLLILGDGPFGILIATLAGGLDLNRVVVAGHHDWRLALAAGSVAVNTAGEVDPLAALRRHGGELGYDAAILAVGSATAARWGLELLRPKGRLVVFSAIPEPTPVDLFSLHVRELEIVGACNDDDRLDEALAALAARREELGRLVTHRLPLERYEEAFHLAEYGRDTALKVAFTFEQGLRPSSARTLLSSFDLTHPWEPSPSEAVLEPALAWEGRDLPLRVSQYGAAKVPWRTPGSVR